MTFCMLAASAALLAYPEQPPAMTLDEIIAANAATAANIRSIVVKVKRHQTKASLLSGGELELGSVYTYRKQADRERLTTNNVIVPKRSNGDSPGYMDQSSGPDGLKAMIGYDPSDPPSLGEFSPSKAAAHISPRKTIGRSVEADLLLGVRLVPKVFAPAELVKGATSATILAGPADSPRHCYEVEVRRPEMDYRISFDPAANYMIRRVEYVPTPASKPHVKILIEAVAFKDWGDGVFLPTEIRSQMTENGHTMHSRVEFEVASCNRPIPEEEFNITFPDWLLVVDGLAGKIHRWGPDERPRLTFDNADAYQRWWQPREAKMLRDQRARWFPWSLAMGVLTLGVAGFAILRSRRGARAA
jgi:hypothetical protein